MRKALIWIYLSLGIRHSLTGRATCEAELRVRGFLLAFALASTSSLLISELPILCLYPDQMRGRSTRDHNSTDHPSVELCLCLATLEDG